MFYIVGHRGTRGFMPENTIPGFKRALEIGANTLEFDIHLTKDHRVIIHHDNSFSPFYTTQPDGRPIAENEREHFRFYQMDYQEIEKFMLGKENQGRFPFQKQISASVPLLSKMFEALEGFVKEKHRPRPTYLLEIKSNPDPSVHGVEQASPEEYMKALIKELSPYLNSLKGRLIIQSFDPAPLRILKKELNGIPLGFLMEEKSCSLEKALNQLNFAPDFYNPCDFLVSQELVDRCHRQKIKVLPWTVQRKPRIRELVKMGVDGIISDYPNRVREVLAE